MPHSVVREWDRASSDRKEKRDIMKAGKIAMLVIGKGPKAQDDGQDEGMEGADEAQGDVGPEELGQELMDAIHSKDPKAIYDAICGIVQMHMDHEETEGEDTGEHDSYRD